MDFSFDPAYLQLLHSNQELRKELSDEVDNNNTNEKKIRLLIKELEQCNRTVSLQDSTIIYYESEKQELKSRISNLEKRLRNALVDIEHKEESLVILDSRIN